MADDIEGKAGLPANVETRFQDGAATLHDGDTGRRLRAEEVLALYGYAPAVGPRAQGGATTCITWTATERDALRRHAQPLEALQDVAKRLALLGTAPDGEVDFSIRLTDDQHQVVFDQILDSGLRGDEWLMGLVTYRDAQDIDGLGNPITPKSAARWGTCTRAEVIRQADSNHDALMQAHETIRSLRDQVATAFAHDTAGYTTALDEATEQVTALREENERLQQAGITLTDTVTRLADENDNLRSALHEQRDIATSRGTLLMPDIRFADCPTVTVPHGATVTIHVTAPVVIRPTEKD